MTGRILAALLLLAVAAGCTPKPTSVLFISIDTLRADAVAGMPNLARLAAEGISFPRVYAASNWTLPSHASLLLSQPPSEHRAALTGKPPLPHSTLPDGATLISEVFRAQGYRTLSNTEGGYVSPIFGFARGFDHVTIVPALSHEPTTDLDRHIGNVVGFVKEAKTWPVFAFVHTYRLHDYFLNIERFQSELLPEDEPWKARGSLLGLFRQADGTAPTAGMLHRLYRGAALETDRFLGRFLSAVQEADPKRRWLIVVTSDHGESFTEDPRLRGHGSALIEEQLRVPWIVSSTDPELRAELSERRPAPVANGIDVASSLLGLLGMPVPPTFRGRSDLLVRSASPAEVMLESSFVSGGDDGSAPLPNLALLRKDRALRTVWTQHAAPTFECYRRESGLPGLEVWRHDPGTCREFEVVARDRIRAWIAANVTELPRAGAAAALSEELAAELRSLGYL